MEKIEKKIVRQCMSGSIIVSYKMFEDINKDFVNYLAQLGELTIYDDIPEPFFKVEIKGYGPKATISGIINRENIRFVIPTIMNENEREEIEKYIYKYYEK